MDDHIKKMHDFHKEQRDVFAKVIERIESGMTTSTNRRDDTAETLARFKELKVKTEKMIAETAAKYGLD
jgi:hypothetical protein